MSKQNTKSGRLGGLQRLLVALTANSGELTFLEASRVKFAVLVNQSQEFSKTQDALVASKQEASQQLKAVLTDGERLATVLRLAVKQHYGIRAEKLAEFGVQPFRGRPKKVQTPPGTPGTPGTPGGTSTPTHTPVSTPAATPVASPAPASSHTEPTQ